MQLQIFTGNLYQHDLLTGMWMHSRTEEPIKRYVHEVQLIK